MSVSGLDRAVWHSLSTAHRERAIAHEGARRLHASFGPFASAVDDDPASLQALGALVEQHGSALLLQAAPVRVPVGIRATLFGTGYQMSWHADPGSPAAEGADLVELTAADAPRMRELARIARPGPFAERTHELGRFLGIRRDGLLVAMAGERLRAPDWVEVSGVSTDPGWLGHGFATRLVDAATRRIAAEGRLPILHVLTGNDRAIAVYERLGYRVRAEVSATTVSLA